MIDKQTQERILVILGEMQKDITDAVSLQKMRSSNEYISFFREMKGVVQKQLSPERQECYHARLDSLIAILGKMEQKHAAGKKQRAECAQLLKELEEEIRGEKELKKIIVFLPYNASMWDSMESVWRVAQADEEHCNAYVIPIPYCDKRADGSPKKWHCEADKFPKDVPVLDWKRVDLQKLHPDVIVVHDPYEETNRVTSVESRYYTKNLRNCTDKLVYIPYFVFAEPNLNNKGSVTYISKFALQPGVVWSHLTIVQSEAVREIYIRALSEQPGSPDRAFWEKRILGLGSPKIDKILSIRKEDFALPEEWRRVISGKKVILYNTSLTDALNQEERLLGKIRDVIETLRQSKDATLWWRPHPLLEVTLRAMRPKIIKGYEEIVANYRKEGWGIYDDTSEMHRAIAYSDAMYGDGSSIAILYRMTGKPVLVQNYGVLSSS